MDDDNISLNVSLMAPTTAEVICSALRHRLLRTDAGRARVTSDAAGLAKLEELLFAAAKGAHGHSARLRDLTVGMICPPALTEPRGAVAGSDDDDDDDDGDDIPTFNIKDAPPWLARATAQTADATIVRKPALQPHNPGTARRADLKGRRDRLGPRVWELRRQRRARAGGARPPRHGQDELFSSQEAMASGDWAALAPRAPRLPVSLRLPRLAAPSGMDRQVACCETSGGISMLSSPIAIIGVWYLVTLLWTRILRPRYLKDRQDSRLATASRVVHQRRALSSAQTSTRALPRGPPVTPPPRRRSPRARGAAAASRVRPP